MIRCPLVRLAFLHGLVRFPSDALLVARGSAHRYKIL
jgi:hypothetical protein